MSILPGGGRGRSRHFTDRDSDDFIDQMALAETLKRAKPLVEDELADGAFRALDDGAWGNSVEVARFLLQIKRAGTTDAIIGDKNVFARYRKQPAGYQLSFEGKKIEVLIDRLDNVEFGVSDDHHHNMLKVMGRLQDNRDVEVVLWVPVNKVAALLPTFLNAMSPLYQKDRQAAESLYVEVMYREPERGGDDASSILTEGTDDEDERGAEKATDKAGPTAREKHRAGPLTGPLSSKSVETIDLREDDSDEENSLNQGRKSRSSSANVVVKTDESEEVGGWKGQLRLATEATETSKPRVPKKAKKASSSSTAAASSSRQATMEMFTEEGSGRRGRAVRPANNKSSGSTYDDDDGIDDIKRRVPTAEDMEQAVFGHVPLKERSVSTRKDGSSVLGRVTTFFQILTFPFRSDEVEEVDPLPPPKDSIRGNRTLQPVPFKETTGTPVGRSSIEHPFALPPKDLTTEGLVVDDRDDEQQQLIEVTTKKSSSGDDLVDPDRVLFSFPEDSQDSVSIRVCDVEKLSQDTFLNDSLIDFYLKHTLAMGIDGKAQHQVHVFTSYLYSKLTDGLKGVALDFSRIEENAPGWYAGYAPLKRWTVGVDLFSKSCIIFPINSGFHWSFAACCFENRLDRQQPPRGRILTFDSAAGISSHNPVEIAEFIRLYLSHEFESRIKRKHEPKPRKVVVVGSSDASAEDDDDFVPEVVDKVVAKQPNIDPDAFVLDNLYFDEDLVPVWKVPVPQQRDGVNCGVHLLNNSRRLIQLIAERFPDGIYAMDAFVEDVAKTFNELQFRTEDANKMRDELKSEIKKIAEQAKLRRSLLKAAKKV